MGFNSGVKVGGVLGLDWRLTLIGLSVLDGFCRRAVLMPSAAFFVPMPVVAFLTDLFRLARDVWGFGGFMRADDRLWRFSCLLGILSHVVLCGVTDAS